MKKDEKTRLKSMSVKELQQELIGREREKMALETYMLKNDGTSVLTRNYPKTSQSGYRGNLNNIKKDIARIKTLLHIKMVG